MSLWMLVRVFAGLAVVAAVGFTLAVARHVRGAPAAGKLSEWLPVEADAMTAGKVSLPEISQMPEFDPGHRLYTKATELLAAGDISGAASRLQSLVNTYPKSATAVNARRLMGRINLDELLTPAQVGAKELYKVKPGDSYLGIAGKFNTSLDMILSLNGLMGTGRLQPGDELLVLPLNFRIVVELKEKTLALWEGERFLVEYPLVAVSGKLTKTVTTTITSKDAVSGGKHYLPSNAGYRGGVKQLMLKSPAWQITAAPEQGEPEGLAPGLYLSGPDMEELALLTRPGNEVEIRAASD